MRSRSLQVDSAEGWGINPDPDFVRHLGLDPRRLEEFGSWATTLPCSSEAPDAFQGCVVIKNGWIVGEWYSSKDGAERPHPMWSNTKTVAALLLSVLATRGNRSVPSLDSQLYDQRWSADGLPLSASHKADIRFWHVFAHLSGLMPNEQPGFLETFESDQHFESYLYGRGHYAAVSGGLFFSPGNDSLPLRARYSCLGFHHLCPIFSALSGYSPSAALQEFVLRPLGIRSAVAVPAAKGAGGRYSWNAASGLWLTARDFARILNAFLRRGGPDDYLAASESWIDGYLNVIRRYCVGLEARRVLGDRAREVVFSRGAGMTWGWAFPSIDLIVVRVGSTPTGLWHLVETSFIRGMSSLCQ